MSERQQLEKLLNNPNARKMLDLIANAEGVKHGYNTLFGNERVGSLKAHPNVRKQFKQTDGKTNTTTAAGRYQFLKPTWDGLARQYGLTDFSPRNQDLGALALIKRRGALDDVLKGDYRSAVNKLGKEWASLPSSPYTQPKKSWGQLGLEGNSAKGSRMQKANMNDLHSLFKGVPTTQKANITGRQLRPGFASDIPPELRSTAPIPQGRKVSSQNSNLASMNDLHSLFTAQKRANFTPPNTSKAADQKAQKEQLKKQGPTQFWESGLLSLADIGIPVVQAAEYAADGIRGAANKVLGTNFETDRYEKLTKTYKDIDSNHKTVRKANNQGMDVVRMGGNMLLTAPLAAAGGTLKAGVPLASKAGAEFLARNAAVGATMGATGIHENNMQRLQSMGAGALGGAIGAGVGQKVGEGVTKVAQKARNKAADVLPRFSTVETNRILQSIDDKLGTTNINVDLHINNALKTKGLKLSDLSDDVAKGLRAEARKALESGKNLSPEAVVRKAVLDRVGIRGTRAQVTGDPKLWQQEAELAKVPAGDALRDKFIADNKRLAELLDESITATGGRSADQYGVAQDALETLAGRYAKNKEFIGSAYNTARNAQGGNAVLDGKAFAAEANDILEQNYASMSLPASVKKMLKDVEKNPEMFTLNKADEFIKLLNSEYKSALKPITGENTSASRAIGLVRDALNNRQAQALDGLLGNDSAVAYKFARDAYKANAGLVKDVPMLQDAIKGVKPDKIFESRILGGKVDELSKTIDVLSTNNPQVVRDIKQQTLEWISGKAIGQNGQPSPAAMKSALDKIGDRKLSILFSPNEVRRIKDIGMAMEYLVSQPAHSYVNNSNTASGLMGYFGRFIKSAGDWGQYVPVIGNNIVQPLQGAATKVGVSRATNGAASLASKTPLPATQTSQSIIDQLRKAGLISGANLQD